MSRWWFQIFFAFYPCLGKWSNLQAYFLNGLIETTNQCLSRIHLVWKSRQRVFLSPEVLRKAETNPPHTEAERLTWAERNRVSGWAVWRVRQPNGLAPYIGIWKWMWKRGNLLPFFGAAKEPRGWWNSFDKSSAPSRLVLLLLLLEKYQQKQEETQTWSETQRHGPWNITLKVLWVGDTWDLLKSYLRTKNSPQGRS